MKHVLMMLILVSMVLGTWQTADADATKDLAWVRAELQKPANIRKPELIDSMLKSIVRDPAALTPADYRDARMIAAERAAQAASDMTQPQRRAALNDACLDTVKGLGTAYLPAGVTDPQKHLDIRRMQLDLLGRVSDRDQASAARDSAARGLLKGLQATCAKSSPAQAAIKETILRAALGLLGNLSDETERRAAKLTVLGLLIDTGTPRTREFYTHRANLHLETDDVSAAAADLAALAADTVALPRQRLGARVKRMDLLVSHGRSADAAPDMKVLAGLSIDNGVWNFAQTVHLKRRAADLALAVGAMTWDAYLQNAQSLVLAVMAAQVNAAGIDRDRVAASLGFTARFVRAKFESVALANAFLASQSYGPAGPDGKTGTADDTPNPLSAH